MERFWIKEEQGMITFGYEDYNVGVFNGASCEHICSFDEENSIKLKSFLKETPENALTDRLTATFGSSFNSLRFKEFCDQHQVQYKTFTWID